jgi:hypothetical protein
LSNSKINQLHIQKNRQVALKKQAQAQHMPPLDYHPSVLAHTHRMPANSAPASHMLMPSEQPIPATPSSARRRKVRACLAYFKHMLTTF